MSGSNVCGISPIVLKSESETGSSVHGILQARILEWVAIPFSRGSSWPRDQTQVSWLQADSLPSEPPGIEYWVKVFSHIVTEKPNQTESSKKENALSHVMKNQGACFFGFSMLLSISQLYFSKLAPSAIGFLTWGYKETAAFSTSLLIRIPAKQSFRIVSNGSPGTLLLWLSWVMFSSLSQPLGRKVQTALT